MAFQAMPELLRNAVAITSFTDLMDDRRNERDGLFRFIGGRRPRVVVCVGSDAWLSS